MLHSHLQLYGMHRDNFSSTLLYWFLKRLLRCLTWQCFHIFKNINIFLAHSHSRVNLLIFSSCPVVLPPVCLSVCPSVYPSVCPSFCPAVPLSTCISAAPTRQILVQSVEKNTYLFTIWQNVGHFTWRPHYVLLLPATLNCHIITNAMASNCLDSPGSIIHQASAPHCYVTIVSKLLFIIDLSFTNAHVLGPRKLESCRRQTAYPYMDLGSCSTVFLESTKAFLQITNYKSCLFIYVLNILWCVAV
jgi:hypothetical protein